MDGVPVGGEHVERITRRIIEAVFGPDATTPDVPDDLFDHALAAAAGEDAAALFPTVHGYLQSVGLQNAHYQAIVGVLMQEQNHELETPPLAAQFDFSYLPPAVPAGRQTRRYSQQWALRV